MFFGVWHAECISCLAVLHREPPLTGSNSSKGRKREAPQREGWENSRAKTHSRVTIAGIVAGVWRPQPATGNCTSRRLLQAVARKDPVGTLAGPTGSFFCLAWIVVRRSEDVRYPVVLLSNQSPSRGESWLKTNSSRTFRGSTSSGLRFSQAMRICSLR